MERERFEVYVNTIHKYARGHRIGCEKAKIHGGHTTNAGGHMEPFDSPDGAEIAGHMTGFPFDWCSHCRNDLRQLAA